MIDDTKPRQRKPTKYVSFTDLEKLGFQIYVQEFDKVKENGEVHTAVKIVKVLKDGAVFGKADMQELLHVLGINTLDEGAKYWCCPKRRHRCLSEKEPVYHYRLMGYERLDDTYLRSGRASLEAVMWNSGMSDMQEVTDRMKTGGDE